MMRMLTTTTAGDCREIIRQDGGEGDDPFY